MNSKPTFVKNLKSYKTNEKFELKPGDRSAILNLPKLYREYIDHGTSQDAKQNKNSVQTLETHSLAHSTLSSTSKLNKKPKKSVDELKKS